MKVEVAVLGSPSLIVLNMVSVDVKQDVLGSQSLINLISHGFCGHKATLKKKGEPQSSAGAV